MQDLRVTELAVHIICWPTFISSSDCHAKVEFALANGVEADGTCELDLPRLRNHKRAIFTPAEDGWLVVPCLSKYVRNLFSDRRLCQIVDHYVWFHLFTLLSLVL